jgi:hypothetical protein
MLRFTFGLIGLGGVLCFIGYQDFKASEGAAAEPQAASLIKLEHGIDPPNKHIEIGEHVAVYDALVYTYEEEGFSSEVDESTRIQYCFYPIVSLAHPFVTTVLGSDGKPLHEEITSENLEDFKVVIRTGRFDKVGDLPRHTLAREEKVSGLIFNGWGSLDAEDKRLLKEMFPKVELEKLIIVHENRQPASTAFSFGMIGGGGLLAIVGVVMLFAVRSY